MIGSTSQLRSAEKEGLFIFFGKATNSGARLERLAHVSLTSLPTMALNSNSNGRLPGMKWIMLLSFLWFSTGSLVAQDAGNDGKIMLTVILRHDQSKTLDEIDDHLAQTGFIKNFPPDGVEIVSYRIVMGIGHIITLRLPPEKLREVNVAFEKGAWGAFRTEFYPTYDYLQIFNELKQKPVPLEKTPSEQKKPAIESSPTPTATPKRSVHRRSS